MTHKPEQQQQQQQCESESDDEAERDADGALDAIVGELRAYLAAPPDAVHTEALAASIALWLEIIMNRSRAKASNSQDHQLHNEEAADDAEDTAEVLLMVLAACLQNKWRERTANVGSDVIGQRLYTSASMEQLVVLLAALVSPSDSDETLQPDAVLTACEVVLALGRLTQSESELTVMLDAWRNSAKFSDPRRLSELFDTIGALDEITTEQRLAICYVHFVSGVLQDNGDTTKEHKPILSDLVGDDISLWRKHKWEQRWQLFDSPAFYAATFGSGDNCEAMVRAVLQGFSIPQIDADAVTAIDLPSFLLSFDFGELLGLRHRVDATLVRDGATHPDWQLGDVLQYGDIMTALKNKYTIGIRGVHARSLLASELCSALQDELKQHANANIYWTPPGEQGFNLHVDDHCVFVIQLKGKKNWHLQEPIGVLPSLYSDLSESLLDAGSTEQLVLEPGNVLYIPRGTPHCADTKGLQEDSIHLTVGVEVEKQFTKRELVLELLSQKSLGASEEHLGAIRAAVESETLRNDMRGGLMSWHLEDDSAFHHEIVDLVAKVKTTLDNRIQNHPTDDGMLRESRTIVDEALERFSVSDPKLSSLRRKQLEDRASFLSSRRKLTRLFALLHRSLHSSVATTTSTPAAAACDLSFHASKRLKR